MPKDTISVSLVQNRLITNKINYYNPLLIYKSSVLESKYLALSVTNFEELLKKLEIQKAHESDSSKKKIAGDQLRALQKSMGDFFGQKDSNQLIFMFTIRLKRLKIF